VLEVNGLSDMSVQIELGRQHSRAPIDAVTVGWWRKSGNEFREAMLERNRTKLGRMARLRGVVETIGTMTPPALKPLRDERVERTVQAMREAGAPQSDIDEFLKTSGDIATASR
jgi:hypothetical protein